MPRFCRTLALMKRTLIDMEISFKNAVFTDCEEIQRIQEKSFASLLEKYQDFDTNPATETLEKIQYKFNQDVTKYYFIMSENVKIGVIRLVSIDETTMRISPVMILPEYQNKGFAQKTFYEMEKKYPYIKVWQLDTIKQEEKLCYLYEKLGYTKTGREEDIKQGMTIIYYQKVIK